MMNTQKNNTVPPAPPLQQAMIPIIDQIHKNKCEETESDLEEMKKKIEEDPDSLNRSVSDICHSFPLYNAIMCNHVKCVKFLLESGADVNYFSEGHDTNPLILALHVQTTLKYDNEQLERSEKIIELLLQHGASSNVPQTSPPMSNCKYLEYGALSEGWKTTQMLLDHGCQIEDLFVDSLGRKVSRRRCTPIINSIHHTNLPVFKLLLLNGASINFFIANETESYSIAHSILRSYIHKILHSREKEALDALYAFKMHGGNLWYRKLVCYGHMNILECLHREIWFLRRADIERKVEELMSTPLSLQSQCRIALRNTLGRNYLNKIDLLPLPNAIIAFLHFPDLE